MKKLLLTLIFCLTISQNIAFASEIDSSKIGALGAILIDAKTGRVLWEKNADKPLAMASTTKIMTATVALENANPEDIVTISKSVLSIPEVKLHLSPNEKIKLKYLLLALMLESSNDAAVAIAEHIGGSVENFCTMMNQKAKQIGATNTTFETPNGLDSENHHSTAKDMAMITRYAFNNPDFIKLINTPSATFSSDKKTYTVNNKNRLLNEFDGANGVKTGFTGKAGHCFVGAAKQNDMQLISVVLGSGWGNKGKQQKWIDTKQILKYGFDNYKYQDIILKNDKVDSTNVLRSKTLQVDLEYEDGLNLPLSSEKDEIKIKFDIPEFVKAPIKKGQLIGKANIFVNDELYTQINLISCENAERHDLKTSIEKILDNWLKLGTMNNVKIELPME